MEEKIMGNFSGNACKKVNILRANSEKILQRFIFLSYFFVSSLSFKIE